MRSNVEKLKSAYRKRTFFGFALDPQFQWIWKIAWSYNRMLGYNYNANESKCFELWLRDQMFLLLTNFSASDAIFGKTPGIKVIQTWRSNRMKNHRDRSRGRMTKETSLIFRLREDYWGFWLSMYNSTYAWEGREWEWSEQNNKPLWFLSCYVFFNFVTTSHHLLNFVFECVCMHSL